MKFLAGLDARFGKRKVRIGIGVIAVLILVVVLRGGEDEVPVTQEEQLPVVSVSTPLELSGEQTLQLIGTVRSVDEATIDSEVSSRVTGVYAELGADIAAGTVIAELENASEFASLLQAEGAYEAALAAAAQSDSSLQNAETGLTSAQNNALSAFRGAYTTVSGVVYGDIDTFYRNPQSANPSLQIGTNGNGNFLRGERTAIEATLSVWQQSTLTLDVNGDLSAALTVAETNTLRVIDLLDAFIELSNDGDIRNDTVNGVEVGSLTTSLVAARANLNGTLSSLQGAQSSLDNAAQSLNQAQIASTQGTDFSAANAQVKQALGSLRAAQANYQKTLLRSPISGVLQSLSVQRGDFVSSFQTVAKVVGEGGLEVTTFVGDSERDTLAVGQTVELEGGATGIVTNIAPAVDDVTKKTEVRIGTEDETINSGDTIQIFITQEQRTDEVIVPLAAVKLTAEDAAVFTVEDGVLVANPVVLGDVRGSTVVIESGLEATQTIVEDVRGFASGQQVEVK